VKTVLAFGLTYVLVLGTLVVGWANDLSRQELAIFPLVAGGLVALFVWKPRRA